MVKKLALLFMLFLLPSLASAQQIDVRFLDIDQYIMAKDNVTLIDVRSTTSRNRSKLEIPGEVWINPKSGAALDSFLASADKDTSYVIFCSCPDDNYSIRTAQILAKNGFEKVFVLTNGWDVLQKNDSIEKVEVQ